MSRRSCAVCQLKDTWNMSGFEGYCRVNIQFDPKKIARKSFSTVSGSIGCGEYHTKNLPKSEFRKVVKSKMASKKAANALK